MSSIFGKKGKSFSGSDRGAARPRLKSSSLSCVDSPKGRNDGTCQYRVFVATWNVGGKPPNDGLNLQDFLQVEDSSDIYVLGFQEIVPLTAGNVLVLEDNEPAARWLDLIHQALNTPQELSDSDEPPEPSSATDGRQYRCHDSVARSSSGNLFFHTPSLKVLSNSYRVDSALVKTCNCAHEPSSTRRRAAEVRDSVYRAETPPASTSTGGGGETPSTSGDDDAAAATPVVQQHCEPGSGAMISYCLIASKQMVGLFLSVWVKKELVEHIGHLRVDCVGRGIMGWLGNKGCIAMSMTLHHSSLCIVCSHLASGEKEGDEVRRNADVAEILKSAHFTRACKPPPPASHRVIPERILEHDQVIWLGDLNYRIALSYDETRTLLEENDWDALLEKDQLMIEREAGRVFGGWKEGKISFAPTYKYTHNSDAYAGETVKSKKKRRTPAWCDRILWHGDGIEQLQYLRGESRFSDHRPVCAVFAVEVDCGGKIRSCYSLTARIGHVDRPATPQGHGESCEPP